MLNINLSNRNSKYFWFHLQNYNQHNSQNSSSVCQTIVFKMLETKFGILFFFCSVMIKIEFGCWFIYTRQNRSHTKRQVKMLNFYSTLYRKLLLPKTVLFPLHSLWLVEVRVDGNGVVSSTANVCRSLAYIRRYIYWYVSSSAGIYIYILKHAITDF